MKIREVEYYVMTCSVCNKEYEISKDYVGTICHHCKTALQQAEAKKELNDKFCGCKIVDIEPFDILSSEIASFTIQNKEGKKFKFEVNSYYDDARLIIYEELKDD